MTVKTSLDLLQIYCTILQQMQQKLRWQTHNYPFTTSKIFGKCLQSAFILWKYSVEYLHTCAPLYVCKGLSYSGTLFSLYIHLKAPWRIWH